MITKQKLDYPTGYTAKYLALHIDNNRFSKDTHKK